MAPALSGTIRPQGPSMVEKLIPVTACVSCVKRGTKNLVLWRSTGCPPEAAKVLAFSQQMGKPENYPADLSAFHMTRPEGKPLEPESPGLPAPPCCGLDHPDSSCPPPQSCLQLERHLQVLPQPISACLHLGGAPAQPRPQ